MKKRVFEACGIDVHKEILCICLIDQSLTHKRVWEAQNTGEGIKELLAILKRQNVKRIAFESTGIYWELLYDLLVPHFDVTLANPKQINAIPGRKTDAKDAEWLATLLVKHLIKKSYVPAAKERQLRGLCRLTRSLKSEKTRYVNRLHKVLDQWNCNPMKHFSSYKTLTCQHLIKALSRQQTWEEALTSAPTTRIKNEFQRKAVNLQPYFRCEVPRSACIELQVLTTVMSTHQEEIERLENEIATLAEELHWNIKTMRMTSIPGIGLQTAIALYSEFGDITKFPTPKHLVSWCGLAPSVYQSAGKHYNGKITKQGNRHIRHILHNCLVPGMRQKNTDIYKFYQRLRKTKPTKVAKVALMAKILRIIHHLLTFGETFVATPRNHLS